MKYIATATAAMLLSISAMGIASAEDEDRPFGTSTVSGTIGGVAAEAHSKDDSLTVAFLTF